MRGVVMRCGRCLGIASPIISLGSALRPLRLSPPGPFFCSVQVRKNHLLCLYSQKNQVVRFGQGFDPVQKGPWKYMEQMLRILFQS